MEIVKIRLQSRQSGNLLLVIIALICLAGILYLGYKIITKLMDWHPDPHHGQGTNAVVDLAWIQDLEASNGPVTVKVGGWPTGIPAEALASDWYYSVEVSTNLVDWEETPLEWEAITNDPAQPAIFYRKLLWW